MNIETYQKAHDLANKLASCQYIIEQLEADRIRGNEEKIKSHLSVIRAELLDAAKQIHENLNKQFEAL